MRFHRFEIGRKQIAGSRLACAPTRPSHSRAGGNTTVTPSSAQKGRTTPARDERINHATDFVAGKLQSMDAGPALCTELGTANQKTETSQSTGGAFKCFIFAGVDRPPAPVSCNASGSLFKEIGWEAAQPGSFRPPSLCPGWHLAKTQPVASDGRQLIVEGYSRRRRTGSARLGDTAAITLRLPAFEHLAEEG